LTEKTTTNDEELENTLKEAHKELKTAIVKLLFDFTDKYCAPESKTYPYASYVIIQTLCEALSEAEYQVKGCAGFTRKQIDHICYQIGDWYLMMKPLLEGQHNLGYMKEKLKIMICGDE